MCVSKPSASGSQTSYMEMVQAAIISARLHSPSLAPHVLYMHLPQQAFAEAGTADEDALSLWLRSAGVRVLNSRLSFFDNMTARPLLERRHIAARTGVCKMEIPRAAHRLAPELAARGLDTGRVLVTDADVLFAGDWYYPPSSPLNTFAAAREVFGTIDSRPTSLNSGVLYFNVSAMVRAWPALLQYAIERGFKFLVADQVRTAATLTHSCVGVARWC